MYYAIKNAKFREIYIDKEIFKEKLEENNDSDYYIFSEDERAKAFKWAGVNHITYKQEETAAASYMHYSNNVERVIAYCKAFGYKALKFHLSNGQSVKLSIANHYYNSFRYWEDGWTDYFYFKKKLIMNDLNGVEHSAEDIDNLERAIKYIKDNNGLKCLKPNNYMFLDGFIVIETHANIEKHIIDNMKEFYYTGNMVAINLSDIVEIEALMTLELPGAAMTSFSEIDHSIYLTPDIMEDFGVS